MRIASSLVFTILFLAGCNDEEVKKTKSGYFTLSPLKSPSNGRIRSANEVTTDFDLGDLKASREFYFILGNGGENPITEITLETNDPRFIVSPQNIGSLPGTNSTGAIIPLISLGVIHGVQLNGVGFTDILEMGEHSIVLTIKGKTIENEILIDLESEFTLTINAKVMDIELSEVGNEIDLTNPLTFTSGVIGAGGLGVVPGYALSSRIVTIKNTGNVDIRVIVKFVGDTETFHDIVIIPNQSSDFDLTHPISVEPIMTLFSLDGNGTVTNYNRIQMGNDGKGYFAIN